MFERTMSIWRRLLGSNSVQATLEKVPEERRRTIRFSGNQEIWYRSAPEETGQETHRAQLVNFSSGGIKLIVDQKFQPGNLLSIQLPDASTDSSTWVLACVVHVHQEEGGGWALGCTFSRELSLEDLQAFGAQSQRAYGGKEQRTSPRLLCEMEASFQIVGEENDLPQKARVENISHYGLGLAVTDQIPVGALLNVELLSRAGDTSKSLLCCAVHVTQRQLGDWVVGCNFMADMEEADLNSLLSS